MPRYYLSIYNGLRALDEEGIERDSLEDAIRSAEAGARELIGEVVRKGGTIHDKHRIEIADNTGAVLRTIYFGDLFQHEP